MSYYLPCLLPFPLCDYNDRYTTAVCTSTVYTLIQFTEPLGVSCFWTVTSWTCAYSIFQDQCRFLISHFDYHYPDVSLWPQQDLFFTYTLFPFTVNTLGPKDVNILLHICHILNVDTSHGNVSRTSFLDQNCTSSVNCLE